MLPNVWFGASRTTRKSSVCQKGQKKDVICTVVNVNVCLVRPTKSTLTLNPWLPGGVGNTRHESLDFTGSQPCSKEEYLEPEFHQSTALTSSRNVGKLEFLLNSK